MYAYPAIFYSFKKQEKNPFKYTVFSWNYSRYMIVADLTNPETFRDLSKPIGALNEKRLTRLRVSKRKKS